MKLFMMLMFLSLSITVLGEGQKNLNVELLILSSDYNQATFYPPAIFMTTNSIISIENDDRDEKLQGLTAMMLADIKDQVLSEGAFRVIKTLSIMEFKNDFNARGPLKKVLKKPI